MNDVTKDLLKAMRIVAQMAEDLKKPCGTNPESPQAIRNSQYMNISYAARAAIARAEAALAEPQPDADGWINPNDKTRKQYLPHIGERVLFCHAGITYYGKHTGGSFQSFNPPRTFETWICLWMYPPKAREAQP